MTVRRWELVPSDRFVRAFKKLRKQDPQTARRIAKDLTELQQLSDPTTRCKALTGPLAGLWRLRVGDHRVIVDVHRGEMTPVALDLGHRSDIYE